ncbi:hypothetical protein HDV04_000025 [Boothiomyces sp. JEL0838]|nr:hypothetical protein HDV04_000025 [Boothiomyces sp. JEL0838]
MDLSLVYDLAKTVTDNRFDLVLHKPEHFVNAETDLWMGNIWADLTKIEPSSTKDKVGGMRRMCGSIPLFTNSLEHLLYLIFNRYDRHEFQQGMFLVKAEFGQDWFTPIMQHPHCILRQPVRQVALRRNSTAGTEYKNLTPNVHQSFVLFYLGPNVPQFCATFYPIGLIPGINSWSAVVSVEEDARNEGQPVLLSSSNDMQSPNSSMDVPFDQSNFIQGFPLLGKKVEPSFTEVDSSFTWNNFN